MGQIFTGLRGNFGGRSWIFAQPLNILSCLPCVWTKAGAQSCIQIGSGNLRLSGLSVVLHGSVFSPFNSYPRLFQSSISADFLIEPLYI